MENHMSKITSLIRRAPKRFSAVVAMVAAAIIVPAMVLGWGPTDRPTYTVENPADHVTFNSITNNPDYGDERNFVRIKDAADTAAGNWKDEITVTGNKEYLVQMYVHNNAADNLNLVALNTKVMANVPNATAKKVQIDGFITSSNATPNQVWDQAVFSSSQDFNLSYVPGSATLYNNFYGQTGKTLSDGIVTSSGAAVGFNALDGKIPGCFKYSGYVSFKVKAQVAGTINFTTEKLVSKHGANNWVDKYAAQPGETVDYLLEYKNVGTTQQDNVIMRDILPAGVTYVNGTSIVGNSQVPAGAKVSDNVTTTGINAGSYAPGANAWLIFSGKVAAKEQLKCGDNTLVNKVRLSSGGFYKEDDATVTVKKECVPEVVKITVCELATKKIVTINEKDFDAKKYSKNLEDCKTPVKITVCELATKKIVTINEKDFDAKKYSKDLNDCKAPVKITVCELATKKIVTIDEKDFDAKKYSKNLKDCEVKKITVCELATKKIVTIDEKDFDAKKYSKDLNDCKTPAKITVCELATKKIVTINEKDFDAKKYSKNLDDCKTPNKIVVCEIATKKIVTINEKDFDAKKYSKNLDDCKAPEQITVCEIATKQIVTINKADFNETKYSADLNKCAETPVTPPELPHTGAGENIVAILGLGSLVAGVAYYIASRRALGL